MGNSLLQHPPSIILSSPSQTQSQNSNPSSAPASAPASSSSNSSATPHASAQSAAQTQAAKQAFLAPFELFYDALHDARQLKVWLNEQLTRTAALTRRWEDEVAKLEKEREDRAKDATTQVKREEVDPAMSLSGGLNVELREELERLRRRVDELEGRLGSAPVSGNGATTTASSSSSTSSHSSHEGYTFPQQQPQRYEQHLQHQPPQQREREQRQDQQPPQHPPLPQNQRDTHTQPPVTTVTAAAATASLPVKPLPAISRRLSLTGRPELGRRLSSPGWHPSSSSSSIRGSGRRAVGTDGERERDDRHGHGMVGMSVSKSLSGPGTCGGGLAGSAGSGSRRRGRRVSISGEVVPSGVRDKAGGSLGPEQLGGESGTNGRERADREGREAMEEREERHGDDEGGMNVDSVGGVEDGGEMRRERGGGGGEQERNREGEKEEEKDNGREESRK
jgi:hypothetical protein